MTQELRKLAEAAMPRPIGNMLSATEKSSHWISTYEARVALSAACTPAAILALLDRVEKAEKDAERWCNLCDLVNEERVSVTFYGRVKTINSGLEVHDSGDLHDELDIAMEASK